MPIQLKSICVNVLVHHAAIKHNVLLSMMIHISETITAIFGWPYISDIHIAYNFYATYNVHSASDNFEIDNKHHVAVSLFALWVLYRKSNALSNNIQSPYSIAMCKG